MAAEAPAYPLQFSVEHPETLSRWLIFIKWLLAFPHYLIVGALGYVVNVITFIAFFAILFTKRYPRGLFDFVVNVYRWQENVGAYVGLLRDEYPPFSWEPGKYPLNFSVDYPEQLSRWMIFLKWLLAIPHYIVLLFLGIAALIVYVIAWFAILFTGAFPQGLYNFGVGYLRWSLRVESYMLLMRDEYPPFSFES